MYSVDIFGVTISPLLQMIGVGMKRLLYLPANVDISSKLLHVTVLRFVEFFKVMHVKLILSNLIITIIKYVFDINYIISILNTC